MSIDQRKCIGCGICVENSEGVMDVIDDKAKIIAGKGFNLAYQTGIRKVLPGRGNYGKNYLKALEVFK